MFTSRRLLNSRLHLQSAGSGRSFRFAATFFGAAASQSFVLWLIFAPTYRAEDFELLIRVAISMVAVAVVVGFVGALVGRFHWLSWLLFGLLVSPVLSLAITAALR